jgi:electron transport complex protein RnfE
MTAQESLPARESSPDRDPVAGVPELAAAIVPSLAAAVTLSAALWLSAAAIAALLATALVAALVVRRVPPAAGAFVVLLAAAALACATDRAASAWLPSVHAALGIYLPLAVVVMSGPVAAAVLGDARPDLRLRRAVSRALVAGGAFLGGVGLTALVREALGAGVLTFPVGAGSRGYRIAAIAEAPARGLLAPFAGLVAAGYLAGLVVLVARRAARRASRRGAGGGAP